MKKMRFVVLAFMLIMLMCVSSAFAAEPGETVTVNMNLSNSDAIIFTLGSPSYDASALEVVGQNPAAGHTFVDINSDGYTPYPSGKIGTVTVKIRDNAKPGTYTISFSTSGAVSVDLGSARLSVSATVTVVCPHTNTETIPGKAATCTETGLTDGTKCSACGVVIKAQETIPANGHTEEVIPGKAATCTETGLTDGTKCSVCGVVIKAQEEIPAKGHTEEVIPGKAATCTEAGLTEGSKCTVCGVIIKAQETIPANGHTEEVIPGKAATCTETGLTDGTKCSACGVVIKAQETIPAKGHTEEVIPGKEATCTETGLTEGKKCTVCGVVIKAQETIPAKGHTEEVIPGKAATCTETGLTDGTKCSVCDVVIKAQEEIPANGHIEVTVPGKDSTCAEAGLTEGSECAVCGVVIKAQEEIPTKEHNFNKHVVDPTTTSRGYTIYTCKVCEYTYTANYTNKLDSDEDGMCAYGDIVTSAEGEYKEYTADAIEDEIKILVITAEPEEDGTYATRNLHLSSDLLAVFKAEGIIEIYFVVGNAAVNIPVAIFENEAMKAAADAENCNNFVITLSIADAEIENAISPKYSVVVALDKDEDIDVTENAIGVKLLLPWEGAQSCVNDENVAYTVSQNEEAWVIDVTKVDFYTLIAE